MSVQVLSASLFAQHCTVPAYLHRSVIDEGKKIADDPESVRQHALWVYNEPCWIIANDCPSYEFGADLSYNLGLLLDDPTLGSGDYIFVSVGDDSERYYAWVHCASNEVVAIHKSDCDLVQDVVEISEYIVLLGDRWRTERWKRQGKTLVYSLQDVILADLLATQGPVAAILSELDTKSMGSKEIAYHLNVELDAWCAHAESLEVEPNYAILPQWVDVAEYKVGVTSCYQTGWVSPERVFKDVKLPQYLDMGIDLDLAEVLEGFGPDQDQPRARRRRRRQPKP